MLRHVAEPSELNFNIIFRNFQVLYQHAGRQVFANTISSKNFLKCPRYYVPNENRDLERKTVCDIQ